MHNAQTFHMFNTQKKITKHRLQNGQHPAVLGLEHSSNVCQYKLQFQLNFKFTLN